MKPVKPFLVMFAFLACTGVIAGPTDTTVTYFNHLWQETSYSDAVYYRKLYHKENKWHVDGYYKNGALEMRGQFKDSNCKIETDSFFFYHENGTIKRIECFEEGKPVGVWNAWFADGSKDFTCIYKEDRYKYLYYHYNGLLSSMEEYDLENNLLSAKMWDTTGVISSNKYLEILPALDGDENGWRAFFRNNMRFPVDEHGSTLKASVTFFITIDKTGRAIWGDMIGFAHPYIALEIERVVKKMPLWSPAIFHNRCVDYKLYFPFYFNGAQEH